jgi:hypothetical protein
MLSVNLFVTKKYLGKRISDPKTSSEDNALMSYYRSNTK